MSIRFLSTAIALIALATCGAPLAAQEPRDNEDTLFTAEQERDRGPPERRDVRPPRDRSSDEGRDRDDDRSPESRRPEARRDGDQPSPRGPQARGGGFGARGGGGFGSRGGGRGFGGGFAPGQPPFAPPGAPMAGPPHHDGGLDERIARLEHKLDAILHELHALRMEHEHAGPMGQRHGGPGGGPMAQHMPHPPVGPPHPQWGGERFEARRMPAPSHRIEGPPPHRFGPPGPRADGPPREWDSPPPRGDRPRERDRDRDDDDDDDRPRGGQRERLNFDRPF